MKQDSQKKGYEIFWDQSFKEENGMHLLRTFTYSDYDPVTTARAYSNPKIRRTYDRNVNEFKQIEKFGTNLIMLYQSTNRVLAVAGRDIYYYCLFTHEQDGSFKCVFYPADHMPETKGLVRMSMPLAGFRFKNLVNDPKGRRCQIQMYVEASLEGNIPNWVQTQAIGWMAGG